MATKSPPQAAVRPAQPPDEKFWVKYSPHHELPISGMASLAWHTLAVVLIVLVAWVIGNRGQDDMPLEMIQIGGSGGGGGDRRDFGPGNDRTAAAVEAAT